MTPVCGEGEKKAFWRLQEAIVQQSVDHSLFAWEPETSNAAIPSNSEEEEKTSSQLSGPLAHHPKLFRNASKIRFHRVWHRPASSITGTTGLKLTVPLIYLPDEETAIALLDCYQHQVSDHDQGFRLGIYVKEIHGEVDQFARAKGPLAKDTDHSWDQSPQTSRTIYLCKDIVLPDPSFVHLSRVAAFVVSHHESFKTKKSTFRAPNSITYNPYQGSSWNEVCLLEEIRHPRRLDQNKDVFLVMGYGQATDKVWCDAIPHNGQSLQQIRAEVRSGKGNTQKRLRKRSVREHLDICFHMEERPEELRKKPRAGNKASGCTVSGVLSGEEVTSERQSLAGEVDEGNVDAIEMMETDKDVKDSSLMRVSAGSADSKTRETKTIVTVRVRTALLVD